MPRSGILIAGITCAGLVLVGVMVLLIPGSLWLRKRANEASARKSVKAIDAAEWQYRSRHPDSGFTCSFELLDKQSLPEGLSQGSKAGYFFRLSECGEGKTKGMPKVDHFKLNALPIALGKSGNNSFCSDETNKVTVDTNGGSDCVNSTE